MSYNYRWFKDLDQYNGDEYGAKSSFYAMFERVFFDVSYVYGNDLSRLNSEVDDRVRNERHQLAGEVVFDLSAKSALKLSIRQYRLDYKEGSGDLTQLNQEVDTKSIYYYNNIYNRQGREYVEYILL